MARNFEIIEWLDHCAFDDGQWNDIEDCIESLVPHAVVSAGEVIHETSKHLVIVPHRTMNDRTTGAMCILKGDIVKRGKLSVKRKRRKK